MTDTKKPKDLSTTALKNKNKGMEYLSTCPLLFKCKPDYDSAIPFLKSASKDFNALKNIKEEIFCREKLIECFRKTHSLWEEGNESNIVANIKLQSKDYEGCLSSAFNAHLAFYNNGDYTDSTSCITKIANELRALKELKYSEKLLKFLVDSLLKYAHVVYSKDDGNEYVYNAFHLYSSLLIEDNNIQKVIETSTLIIKSINAFIKRPSELFQYYYIKLLCLMLLDNNNEFEEVKKECLDYSEDDMSQLSSLVELKLAIEENNEKEYKRNIYEVTNSLDIVFSKAISNKFNQKKENKEKDVVELEDKDFL